VGVPDIKFGESRWTAFYCFVIVGPLEEGAKALMAYLFVFRWREFDEPIDGFVYAAAISLGFASLENFYNVPELSWLQQLGRTAALPLTHTLFSAIWGFGAAHARFAFPPGPRRKLWQFGTLALAMAAHGLYDFLIFAYQATLITGGLALVLWVFVIWYARACGNRAEQRQS
jgi:RsiW-degrading membrane proteinase PrsW (M82 family)